MARKSGRPSKPTGTLTQTRQGHWLIKLEDGSWVNYGRYVMAEKLGRELHDYERVRYIDGNPGNNLQENLTLEVSGNPNCPHCGQRYYDD